MLAENGIFIGRFQPLHNGHIGVLALAASQVKTLSILVGSANACRSIKNPWTYSERYAMIFKSLRARGVDNIQVYPINDHVYNDAQWMTEVRELVQDKIQRNSPNPVLLFGYPKDGNDYLNWFPEYKFKELPAFSGGISATQIREKLFDTRDPSVPKEVQADWDYFNFERAKFAGYPFPETLNFNCADAVVECQGNILLVQRKFAPGAGTWALPGGFKNRNETFLDTALRELKEETKLKVPEKVLRGSIVSTKLFDSPKRGHGIPRNTLAVYIRIQADPDGKPPKANGADDASKASWFPLNKVVNSMSLFDDHAAIISSMTGVTPSPAYLYQ